MEGVEGALKSSVRKEIAMRLTPPAFIDDLLAVNAQNGVSPEDFSVDDLLDFSNDDVFAEEVADGDAEPRDRQEDPHDDENTLRRRTDYEPIPAASGEISVPADDLANLEWLSHFVEDSFSEYSAAGDSRTPREKPAWLKGDRKHLVKEEGCFKCPVPGKARSKRGRVWSPVGERQRERGQGQRRCSHCGAQRTPQWRAGPLGAKTLCNACGVRYKSGRLLPEYRPACSPTFSSDLHSNHHRRVVEMRRLKEKDSSPALFL